MSPAQEKKKKEKKEIESLLQKLKLPWPLMFLMAVTFCDASWQFR